MRVYDERSKRPMDEIWNQARHVTDPVECLFCKILVGGTAWQYDSFFLYRLTDAISIVYGHYGTVRQRSKAVYRIGYLPGVSKPVLIPKPVLAAC